MKILITLCLSLFASIALACPNLSGSYLDSDNTPYRVIQNDCSSVIVNEGNSSQTILTDGNYRVMEQDAQMRLLAAAQFNGNTLEIKSRLEYLIDISQYPADQLPGRINMIISKDSVGNLVQDISVYSLTNLLLQNSRVIHYKY